MHKMERPGQSSAVEIALIVPVLIGGLLIFLLLSSNYIYPAGSDVNAFQLQAMSQSLINYIITSPGTPSNWGLNATNLTSFGLAVNYNTTGLIGYGQPYQLDPFKVLQLVYWDYAENASGALSSSNTQGTCNVTELSTGQGSSKSGLGLYLLKNGVSSIALNNGWLFMPGSISSWMLNYTEVKRMLGLSNQYDFLLIIKPLLSIQVINFPPSPGSFKLFVKVVNFATDSPAVHAQVSLNYLAMDQNGNDLACAYKINNLNNPCTNAPQGLNLPAANTFIVYSTNPLIIESNVTLVSYTNSSGIANFTLPMAYDGDNAYFFTFFAQDGGAGDYGYFQYPNINTPLLIAGILPNKSGGSIIFADPHLFANCLKNNGIINKISQTTSGLRLVAIYKSISGYVFQSLDFSLNPGTGSQSYPVPCTTLQGTKSNGASNGAGTKSNGASNGAASCYWNLPATPLLLIAYVTPNSNSANVPPAQVLIIPYGIWPEYYLSNREIVFGRADPFASMASSSYIVDIGGSTYTVQLNLYYTGNEFASFGG